MTEWNELSHFVCSFSISKLISISQFDIESYFDDFDFVKYFNELDLMRKESLKDFEVGIIWKMFRGILT